MVNCSCSREFFWSNKWRTWRCNCLFLFKKMQEQNTRKLAVKFIFLIVRCFAIFLAVGDLLGILMFLSTSQPAVAGIPIALLIVSLTPASKLKSRPWLLIIVSALVILSYVIAGVPFLNIREGVIARSLHFTELLLIIIFILQAVLNRVRRDQAAT